ncbi:MAG TPA: hypothetical protein VFV86_10505 [Nitrososphaeraceae archaeon]|nr:hypothetical protein [Nitrososphaeraceae archaeon]
MSFLIPPFFLSLIIGSLSIFFLANLQSVSAQTNLTSVSNLENISVKIISPPQGKQVPIGQLTVTGISSDNQEKNCIVFIDWNDLKPYQPVQAAGPGGIKDFSEWIFTFDSKYHEIVEGTNELTSKITCLDGNKPLTKWYSINVTGYTLDGTSIPSLDKKTTELNSLYNPQIPLQTVMPSSTAKLDNISNMHSGENITALKFSNVIPSQNTPTLKSPSNNSEIPLQTVMPSSTAKLDNISNMHSGENSTDSEIEMIIPKEVTSPNLKNNTKPVLDQTQQTTNTNLTSESSSRVIPQTPRLDLDEQSTTVYREQQPAIEQQQPQLQQPQPQLQQPQPQQPQQPPAIEQQQPQLEMPEQNNSGNLSNGSGQSPQKAKSPTQGVFPPFKLPSLFP